MVPVVVVLGVGAVALPVPPEDTVYHKRLVPVALSADAAIPSHKLTGEVTVGAAGLALTLMVMGSLSLSQVVVASVCVT